MKYIIQNYASHFSVDEKELILRRAYRSLRYYSRNEKKTARFVFFMMRYLLPHQVFSIMKNNRNS
ncbi:MAG: hypothetical protein KBA33_03845 [Cloacibacterium sp.]|nr:hypothetical protein [Cloacibacterium sp.]